jgi:hypothetical protein
MSTAGEPDPAYVKARRVLLEALACLAPHNDALILVGAQAIYLQVGAGHLAVAPFTTDGDLIIEPAALASAPPIEEALGSGGFARAGMPGVWTRDDVEIDLLVPEAVGGAGRRGARLGAHGNRAARKVKGLEGALVDNEIRQLRALDGDSASASLRVAGPAALLVSKLHKIADRESRPNRLGDKDALDVLRLLRGVSTEAHPAGLGRTLADPVSHAVTHEAVGLLRSLFGAPSATGTAMAVRATEGLEDAATVRGSCEALASHLIEAMGGGAISPDSRRAR